MARNGSGQRGSKSYEVAAGGLKTFFGSDRGRALMTAAGCAVGAGIGLLVYAKLEARRFKLEHLRVTTSGGSDSSGNGNQLPVKLRVLHLSDLHLCRPETSKVEFVQQVTDDDYDLIVFTGDIFENYTGIEYAAGLITRKPRLGAYAVLGNHDYYNYTWFNKIIGRMNRKYRHPAGKRDVQPFINALSDAGITVLRNSAITIPDERLHLIGIDYPGISQDQLYALSGQAPDGFLVMSLLHLPRRLNQLPAAGVHMAFAGHTHGGQVRLPGFGALITDSELPRQEASGLVKRGHTVIHVSRGLGADPKTDFRVFCPPAATVVEIEHQP